jgi:hypothetical protein
VLVQRDILFKDCLDRESLNWGRRGYWASLDLIDPVGLGGGGSTWLWLIFPFLREFVAFFEVVAVFVAEAFGPRVHSVMVFARIFHLASVAIVLAVVAAVAIRGGLACAVSTSTFARRFLAFVSALAIVAMRLHVVDELRFVFLVDFPKVLEMLEQGFDGGAGESSVAVLFPLLLMRRWHGVEDGVSEVFVAENFANLGLLLLRGAVVELDDVDQFDHGELLWNGFGLE